MTWFEVLKSQFTLSGWAPAHSRHAGRSLRGAHSAFSARANRANQAPEHLLADLI